MFKKNGVILVIFCLLIFISISSVCASENKDLNVIDDNITNFGTFDDLNSDIQSIHSGDIYNITRNYKFDSKGQTIIFKGLSYNICYTLFKLFVFLICDINCCSLMLVQNNICQNIM